MLYQVDVSLLNFMPVEEAGMSQCWERNDFVVLIYCHVELTASHELGKHAATEL